MSGRNPLLDSTITEWVCTNFRELDSYSSSCTSKKDFSCNTLPVINYNDWNVGHILVSSNGITGKFRWFSFSFEMHIAFHRYTTQAGGKNEEITLCNSKRWNWAWNEDKNMKPFIVYYTLIQNNKIRRTILIMFKKN